MRRSRPPGEKAPTSTCQRALRLAPLLLVLRGQAIDCGRHHYRWRLGASQLVDDKGPGKCRGAAGLPDAPVLVMRRGAPSVLFRVPACPSSAAWMNPERWMLSPARRPVWIKPENRARPPDLSWLGAPRDRRRADPLRREQRAGAQHDRGRGGRHLSTVCAATHEFDRRR